MPSAAEYRDRLRMASVGVEVVCGLASAGAAMQSLRSIGQFSCSVCGASSRRPEDASDTGLASLGDAVHGELIVRCIAQSRNVDFVG